MLKRVGTTVRPSFLVTTLLALVGAEVASIIRAFGSDVPPG
jgi:nucleoside recognition membrane protein YjiH